jgi:hypothetical protein
VDGDTQYEVEAVLNSRMRYRRLEYLVQWKGYDAGENMWVPHYNVVAPEAVAAFHRRNPGAPRRINFASFDSIPFSRADLSLNWRSTHQGR